jgi:hypothetical protein
MLLELSLKSYLHTKGHTHFFLLGFLVEVLEFNVLHLSLESILN